MALKNNYLINARNGKNDEFYTQYKDIESEIMKFTQIFYGKTVYCPCDNENSEFRNFFINNFENLKLKGFYASAIDGNTIFYDGKEIIDCNINNIDITEDEFITFLNKCDIVVTNPPFSLFKKFLNNLINHNKLFLIVGQQNSISVKDVFKHIINGNVTLDYGFKGIAGYFKVPEYYEDVAKAGEHKYGMIRVSGVIWYTNMKNSVKNKPIKLTKSINDNEYKKFVHFREISGLDEDCININKVSDIPYDYFGYMGVPISFFGKYNPDQFELIQLDHYGPLGNQDNVIIDDNGNEKTTYRRLYVRLKNNREKN